MRYNSNHIVRKWKSRTKMHQQNCSQLHNFTFHYNSPAERAVRLSTCQMSQNSQNMFVIFDSPPEKRTKEQSLSIKGSTCL